MQKTIVDDLEALLNVLPSHIQDPLRQANGLNELLEIVMDLGRQPEARFPGRDISLHSREVTQEDLSYVNSRISPFGDDNRAGIERTLHRISCIRNRNGKVVGLTSRVGRAVFGTIRLIEDLVYSGKSILMLGRPGVGKTTMLREVARVLADDARKRVIIVDTSNEIAGDGDIPHPAIGKSRRMQVKTPTLQHAVMIEAVENHMPEVIVIDEMGTELEATAARTIAERGVQLIATAHGNSLYNLIMNPTLSDLIGGIQTVTLGDEEARRRGSQKTILERKAPPTFDIVVEIHSWEKVAVHPDVASTVDYLLRGFDVSPDLRWTDAEGKIHHGKGDPFSLASARGAPTQSPPGTRSEIGPAPQRGVSLKVSRVLPFGVSRDKLAQSVRQMGASLEVVADPANSDLILTTKMHYRRKPEVLRQAEEKGKPIYVLRNNSPMQIEQFVHRISSVEETGTPDPVSSALAEAEKAAQQVMEGEASIELTPQSSYVRRLQHLLAERYNLSSASAGREPNRKVIIYRPR